MLSAYLFNIIGLASFGFQSEAASAAIASVLPSARYALVFTANTFVALGLSEMTARRLRRRLGGDG